MAVSDPAPPAAARAASAPLRRFGRFEIRRLLGRSARSMLWLAFDPLNGIETMLALPRQALLPADLAAWLQAARRAARLDHPHLVPATEVGEHEQWPYAAYDRRAGQTLAERLGAEPEATLDIAGWIAGALDGLAFAHEAGVAHGDLQLHMLVLGESGTVKLLGLEVAPAATPAGPQADGAPARALSVDTGELRARRDAAQRDVLAVGVLLHHLLAGRPALDEPDVAAVIERLPPHGRDIVRLPFSIPRPVPEPLRAIVNRATDRQPRQRYLNARTLARALRGWIEAETAQAGGAHALLVERVRQIGALPATPGGAARAARLALLDREHTAELAQIVLRDLALSFELLRVVNTAQVRGTQVSGNGPVLTVRRAIAMVGLEGVRRAANGLRAWPGPLSEPGARELAALIERTRRAGRLAQALRPAGYDAEVVFLVTMLQNLGRLVVQYHFPDEAVQIRRLMQPLPPASPEERGEPGMNEQQAAYAVLGCDIEGLAAAVARHWGMDDAVLHMMRRLPPTVPVRQPDHDDDVLRAVASAAHEAIDALALPAREQHAALERVAQRYARVLGLNLRDLQAALQASQYDSDVDDDLDDDARSDDDGAATWSAATGAST
ncbi:serine/threonine protein kinase [Azohydromonas sediminis]|uniref:serine/threonine protein kinase n=1 Tax=Azohydromonas sediminis TaxID=2259674 RepID=UPI000E65D02A|nr:HDOD domain-containing protein [Azohydromonas sediminis]